jgi:hypothetical protein
MSVSPCKKHAQNRSSCHIAAWSKSINHSQALHLIYHDCRFGAAAPPQSCIHDAPVHDTLGYPSCLSLCHWSFLQRHVEQACLRAAGVHIRASEMLAEANTEGVWAKPSLTWLSVGVCVLCCCHWNNSAPGASIMA